VSNVWQVEVPERTPAFIVLMCCSGDWMRFTPATMAASQSPASRAVQAAWRAYSEDEQAVSRTTLL
jgi:hypothetical protein